MSGCVQIFFSSLTHQSALATVFAVCLTCLTHTNTNTYRDTTRNDPKIFCLQILTNSFPVFRSTPNIKMGFLTVLKKIRQKEKEMRILLLYPLQTNENIQLCSATVF